MMRSHLLTPPSRLLLLLSLLILLSIELQPLLTAQTMQISVINDHGINDNRQKWVDYYFKELTRYGSVIQLEAQRGISHDLRLKGAIHHHLRFVTDQENHPGYYPKVRLTYYHQYGRVLGVYTSSTTDLVRMGNGQTFLKVDILDVPTDSYRTTLTVLEGDGDILTVFE